MRSLNTARTAWLKSLPMHLVAEWLCDKRKQLGYEVTYSIAELSRTLGYSRETIRISLRHLHTLAFIRLPNDARGGVAIVSDRLAQATLITQSIRDAKRRLEYQLNGGASCSE